MAYFNHAFTKVFLGTGTTLTSPLTDGGFITEKNVPTGGIDATVECLANLPAGYFGFFDPKTNLSVTEAGLTSTCCPLYLASSSVLTNDKIGPFHGGYKETNKSKIINPKYIQSAYTVEACTPKQAIVSVGSTPQTNDGVLTISAPIAGTETYVNGTYYNVILTSGSGTGVVEATVVVAGNIVTSVVLTSSGINYVVGNVLRLSRAAVATPGSLTILVAGTFTTVTVTATATTTPSNFQGGTTASTCCYEFLCGETYYLRIDVKGSPALRTLNHNAYQTLSAYTGCCPADAIAPVLVDSTLVFIEWAKALVINNYLKPFILPVVFDETGVAWYAPGTTVDPMSGSAVLATQWWDAYVSTGHVVGACAGMRLFGAYVGTVFGDCTFQLTDFFEREPIKIYASLVDYNGDPCVFEGICVYNDCLGLQGMGFGDTVLKDFVKGQSYLQNFFHSDFRIREITQGYDMSTAIPRNALYQRYFLLHSVPRFNNPTGTFDNDRYMLEIITPVGGNGSLDDFLETWLGTCAGCINFDTVSCGTCVAANN